MNIDKIKNTIGVQTYDVINRLVNEQKTDNLRQWVKLGKQHIDMCKFNISKGNDTQFWNDSKNRAEAEVQYIEHLLK